MVYGLEFLKRLPETAENIFMQDIKKVLFKIVSWPFVRTDSGIHTGIIVKVHVNRVLHWAWINNFAEILSELCKIRAIFISLK